MEIRKMISASSEPYKGNLCNKKSTCMYATRTSDITICDYIGVTGKPRNSPADNCDKYKAWKKGKKRNKRAVAKEHFSDDAM